MSESAASRAVKKSRRSVNMFGLDLISELNRVGAYGSWLSEGRVRARTDGEWITGGMDGKWHHVIHLDCSHVMFWNR